MRAHLLGSVALVFGLSAPALSEAPAQAETPLPVSTMLPPLPVLAETRLTADDLGARGDPWRLLPEARVPGLMAAPLAGRGQLSYSVRGLGNSSTVAPLASAVGLFVDGVPLGDRDGEAFALFDLQSVELLRGGQGALMGRGTSGGAVLLTLAAPSDTLGGFIGGAWGTYDRKMGRGSVDVPLGVLAVKLSAYVSDDDGFARNQTTGEKVNDRDRAGIRLAARVAATDRLSLNVSLAYVEDAGELIASFTCNPAAPSDCDGRSLTTGLTTARRLGGVPQFDVSVAGEKAGQRLGSRVSTTLLTANVGWRGDSHSLEMITGWWDSREQSGLDFADGRGLPGNGGGPVRGFANGGFTLLTDAQEQQTSQEVRLTGRVFDGALTYVVGGQIIDSSATRDMADLLTAENGKATGALSLLADRVVRTDTQALAGFADATLALGRLTLGAGIRYTDEERSFGQPGGAAPGTISTGIWTPRASASFALGENAALFANVARGYRPGGWNERGLTPGTQRAFAAETAWTYEAGIAARGFGGRLDAKLTAFLLDVSDHQATGAAVVGGVPQFGASTVGDLRNRGVEAELTARPLDGLNLYANLTWQDASYRRALVAADPMFTPDFTIGAGGRWDVPVPSSGAILSPTIDLLWRSAHETDLLNVGPGAPATLLVDGGLAVRTDDDNWLLTLTCRNCLNEDAPTTSLLGIGYPIPPRTWVLAARRQF
ncbi:MAG: TonB-dependent receptor [Sandaracinobacter sp.]